MHSYHSNASTNIHVREQLKANLDNQTVAALAQRYCISGATVHKWRHRPHKHLSDASSRPRRIVYAFSSSEGDLILHLRTTARMPLDSLLDAVASFIPHATRSSLYRHLVRNGERHIPKVERLKHGNFDSDAAAQIPGFLHIDSFLLICLPGQGRLPSNRQHCFVAVDRATRMVYIKVYDNCTGESACDFVGQCRDFFPFAVHTILTDNGGQYTLKSVCPKKHKRGEMRPFEILCQSQGILHKTIRPYTPKTNGLAERVIGIVQQQIIKGHRYADQAARQAALSAWLEHYNFRHYHSRIPIGRMTPWQAVCRWNDTNPELFTRATPDKDNLLQQIRPHSQPPET